MKSKRLIDILPQGIQIVGDAHRHVAGLTIDSRKVEADFVFAALRGTKVDGHDYIPKAVQLGAKVILCEHIPAEATEGISYVVTDSVAKVFAQMAFAYYGVRPDLKVVGVTGTNGKTTVATLLFQLFTKLGHKCGLISTVENVIGAEIVPSTHTTPDAEGLARLMARMQDAGCDYVFMEVSSHALDQGRVDAVPFKGALFTNITRDHLDYHGTFLNYINAKKKFFDIIDKDAFAIVNVDDKNGEKMVESCKGKVKHYALKRIADYRAKLIASHTDGLHMQIDGADFYTPMVGEFNAYNLLVVYGAARELGYGKDEVLTALSSLKGAEGRMDIINDNRLGIKAIIDYAHTPDALENVIETVRKAMKKGQRLITVVGCGGERDKGKRPMMAKISVDGSDVSIFTSDNPRSEDPSTIIVDMMAGVEANKLGQVLQIADRAQAIKTAVMLAQRDDIILLAGKGHEKYQVMNGITIPFEDRKELEVAMAAKS